MRTPGAGERSSMITTVIPFDSVGWSRDHLLAGCVCFPVFVFLAWLCAVVNEHHIHATLSEMVYDWNTAEGKIFIPALLLPSIMFLISSYPYRLANACSYGEGPYDHFFVVCRHFLLNTGLVLMAFVPTLQVIQSNAHLIQTLVHGIAATVAFSSYILSETQVVCCNSALFVDERTWRSRALTFTIACLFLCGTHKISFALLVTFADYSKAWTFRYEMLLGAGVMSGNLMVWTWSDTSLDSKLRNQKLVPWFATIPYIGVIFVVMTDFLSRDNKYGDSFLMIELALFVTVYVLIGWALDGLASRWKSYRGLSDVGGAAAPLSYGAAGSG